MSNTKKKTTAVDEFAQHAANASESRARAVAALEQLTTAREELARTRASALTGDESLTPEQLATARAAVELAELRAVGADKRAAAVHAAAPFRPVLAETVANALQDVLEIPASVVEKVPADAQAPHFYVVQDRAASRAMWGRGYAGQVKVTYKRASIHREMTRDDYVDALDKRGVTVTDVMLAGGPATLKVVAQPTLPYVAALPNTIGQRVADDLAGYLRGGHGRGGEVESEETTGNTRITAMDVWFETDELFGRVSDLLHKTTAAGRVVAAEKLSSGYHQDPVPLPNGDFGVTPEYHRVGVRLTLHSTTTPYDHVLATEAYEPVLPADPMHAA